MEVEAIIEEVPPTQPTQIGGVKVVGRYTDPENCLWEYYILENGSLVAITAKIGQGVGLSWLCRIDPYVVIEDRVMIGPRCILEDQVTIEDQTILHEGVQVRYETTIGAKSDIGAGCDIGCLNYLPDRTRLPAFSFVLNEAWSVRQDQHLDSSYISEDRAVVIGRNGAPAMLRTYSKAALEKSLEELFDWPPGFRFLRDAGITTVAELVGKTDAELLSIKGIGPSTVEYINNVFKEAGLPYNS